MHFFCMHFTTNCCFFFTTLNVTNCFVKFTFKKALLLFQISEILTSENSQDVKITIEKRLGRIRIQGIPTDVMATFEKITAIFREIDRMVYEAQTSEVVAGIVQWYYMECEPTSTSVAAPLKKYEAQLNMVLEKAFIQKEKMKTLMADDGTRYCYDFEAMEEYPDDDPFDRVKMIRKEVNAQSKM